MRLRILFINLLFFSLVGTGQDFSNKGTEFWVGYGSHCSMYAGNGTVNPAGGAQDMVLYFTSDRNAIVTVEIPSIGWTKTYPVNANQVTTSATIPKVTGQDARITDEGKSGKGIHITSDVPIIAYAHIYNNSISGATLLFPVSTLARDYYSINYKQISNQAYSYCFSYVIATEDNTNIEIIPSANTILNSRGDTIKIKLNKGEIYNIFGRLLTNSNPFLGEDLTGTVIRSVATPTSPCKKIAVFSGSGKISISCNNGSGTADNYMQQAFPANAWGKKYLTAPTKDMPNNFFRIAVSKPNTIVKRNGIVITGLINNFYYDYQSSSPDLIESDQPIMVAQYTTTTGQCGNTFIGGRGDPEMIYLSPIEQTIDKVTINSTPNAGINLHYINVVIHKNGSASLKIDGATPVAAPIAHPQEINYVYYQVPLSAGSHTIQSDSGFNAIAYGYGNTETYGYNAGANVKDLTQFVSVKNTFSTVKFPATCKGSPFNLSITLPFRPLKISWDFKGNADLGANPTPLSNTDNSPLLADDSLPNPNDPSKKLYTYIIKKSDGNPKEYKATQKGVIPIDITVINPSPDGCTGEQNISFEIKIYDPPTTEIKYTSTGCFANSVLFEPKNIQSDGRQIIKYIWSTEPGLSDTIANANITKQYTSEGSKPVTLKVITDIGCISEEADISVPLSAKPKPDFDIPPLRCLDKSFQLTDKSQPIGNSSLEKWTWKYLNVANMPPDDFDKNAPSRNPLKTFTQSSVIVRLIVKNNTGCTDSLDKAITVNPNPIVDFDILQTICMPLGNGRFTSAASSISDNSQSQFKYDWNFGDNQATSSNPNASTDPSPVHKYSASGNVNVSLKITSNNGCDNTLSKVFNVNPQPIAKIDFKKEICARETFTFTDISDDGLGNPLQSWSWKFNTTSQYNTKSFTTNVLPSGDYPVVFSGVSANGCKSTEISEIVTIHPLPTPDFSLDGPACEKDNVVFVQNAVANVGSITRWIWRIGNATVPEISTDPNLKLTKTFTAWGDQVVRLLVENSKGCKSDTLVRNIRIHPKPSPGFILPDVCQGDQFAQFESTSTIADNGQSISYTWDFGDPRSNASNPNLGSGKFTTHRYSLAGDYTVKMVATSSAGCVSLLSQAFRVNGAIPKADFLVLSPDSLCSNTIIKLKNLSSVDFGDVTKLEIYWDYTNSPTVFVSDDDPSPDKIYSYLYNDFLNLPSKSYTILVKAYSGGQCVDEEIKTITVNGSPKVNLLPLQGICLEAQPRRLNEASFVDVAGIAAGTENFTGNGVSTNGQFDPSTSGAGTHQITYRFTSSKGCYAEKSGNIVVWPRPKADFTISNLNCEKNAIVFNSSSTANAGTLTTWNWDFGDGTGMRSLNNGNPQSYTYAVYNNYSISLNVVTSNGCTSIPKIVSLKVNPLPVINFDLPKVCLPEGKGVFTNNTDIPDGTRDLLSYLWTYGDPIDPTPTVVKDGIHYFRTLGSYNIKLVATSASGCKDSLSRILSDVFPRPKAGFKSLDSVCLGKDIQYLDTSNGIVRTVVEWNWDFGNGVTNTDRNPLYQHKATGTYPVTLWVKSSEGCISDTVRKTISIFPYPKVSAGPDLSVLDDGEKQIEASAAGSSLLFSWSPPIYLSDIKILQPRVIKPQENTVYTLSVTGRGGCTSKDEISITALKMPRPPNTFTPNGDGINDIWEIKYLDQYPGAILEIYTARGQLVYRTIGYNNTWDGTSNGKPLPFGTYYYVIDPKSGRGKMSGFITILK